MRALLSAQQQTIFAQGFDYLREVGDWLWNECPEKTGEAVSWAVNDCKIGMTAGLVCVVIAISIWLRWRAGPNGFVRFCQAFASDAAAAGFALAMEVLIYVICIGDPPNCQSHLWSILVLLLTVFFWWLISLSDGQVEKEANVRVLDRAVAATSALAAVVTLTLAAVFVAQSLSVPDLKEGTTSCRQVAN